MNEHLNEQLIAAVEAGREKMRLAVSAHEIGHALALLAAGVEPEWVRLNFTFGFLTGGRCDFPDEPEPDATREQLTRRLIAHLAGHAAEARFCRLYLGKSENSAYAYGRDSSDGDYYWFHLERRKFGIRVSHDWAFHHATGFLERHAAVLDRLTLRLDRARHITSAALPAAGGVAA